jgi:hypothetical protein
MVGAINMVGDVAIHFRLEKIVWLENCVVEIFNKNKID